ncbi:TetR family transcriptional regulator [Haloactinospora alba]|uniref:TetR family transcriptional regulator n=1 Tax=Haloactinospora alba TaxID=405555 RepID=A0A543NKY8_9ACTN|nr:TetR/AcrR family transcriptional regulator [Haloactinospora alba]TQN32457.1 TetR family transcriptional regulator [Haloactinospora alba]
MHSSPHERPPFPEASVAAPIPSSEHRGYQRQQRSASPLASQRRANLVHIAAELFARKGFQSTTVREIADEAGILSGSLYHHFDSKESIVDDILSSFLTSVVDAYRTAEAQGGDPREVLARLVRASYSALDSHRSAATVLHNDWNYLRQLPRFDYLHTTERDIQRIWTGVLTDGQSRGVFRSDIDPELTCLMLRDSIRGSVRWHQPDGKSATSELARHTITVLLAGISADGDDETP